MRRQPRWIARMIDAAEDLALVLPWQAGHRHRRTPTPSHSGARLHG